MGGGGSIIKAQTTKPSRDGMALMHKLGAMLCFALLVGFGGGPRYSERSVGAGLVRHM